jgi:hypothetical protein
MVHDVRVFSVDFEYKRILLYLFIRANMILIMLAPCRK